MVQSQGRLVACATLYSCYACDGGGHVRPIHALHAVLHMVQSVYSVVGLGPDTNS